MVCIYVMPSNTALTRVPMKRAPKLCEGQVRACWFIIINMYYNLYTTYVGLRFRWRGGSSVAGIGPRVIERRKDANLIP